MIKKPNSIVSQAYVSMWWFPFFVAAVVILGTVLVLIPQVNGIINASKELRQSSDDLKKAERKISQVNALDVTEIKSLTTLMNQALPGKKPYYEVLLLLQQLGANTGVTLGDFEIDPGSIATGSATTKPGKDGYMSMDTELTITGTTDQVSDFVIKLQESVPLVVVKSINISSDNKVAATDTRTAQLELLLLYMPEAKLITQVDLEPLAPIPSDMDQMSQTLTGFFNPEAIAATQAATMSDFSRTDLFSF